MSTGPAGLRIYYLVDRDAEAIRELFSARPDLKPYRLAGAQPAIVKSRDGLDLVCYVTLPADEPPSRPRAPLPMVFWSTAARGAGIPTATTASANGSPIAAMRSST